MRGKNIPLQHQDHVKNALITPRQVQSAPTGTSKLTSGYPGIKDFQKKSKRSIRTIVQLPSSGKTTRAGSRNYFVPGAQSRSHLPCSAQNKNRPRINAGQVLPVRVENFPALSRNTPTPHEFHKSSLVIKIPQLTKNSR